MRLFIDTNIFLDLLFKRKDYMYALIIFNTIEDKIFEAAILDITILNIDYIANKQTKDIREFLSFVNRHFIVKGASNSSIEEALLIDNRDLEDNLQYIIAKDIQADLIITNDKKFYRGEIPIFTSQEFVKRYLAKI